MILRSMTLTLLLCSLLSLVIGVALRPGAVRAALTIGTTPTYDYDPNGGVYADGRQADMRISDQSATGAVTQSRELRAPGASRVRSISQALLGLAVVALMLGRMRRWPQARAAASIR